MLVYISYMLAKTTELASEQATRDMLVRPSKPLAA
jgi:hypothetical protein